MIPFSFCLQSCPASGSFPMSQLFALDEQRIGVSASASVLPMNIQLISFRMVGEYPCCPRDSQESFVIPQFKTINSLALSFLYREFFLYTNCSLPHNCMQLTRLQRNAQNSPSELQQYMNQELPDVQAGFRKGRGTRDQIASIHWIIEKARLFQINIYFCFTD